jgi:transposase-like protein
MNSHKNDRLTPKGREKVVRIVDDDGLTRAAAARQFNTTPKTVARWVQRFKTDAVEGLRDRSSRPLSSPSQTRLATCSAIEALRRQRQADDCDRHDHCGNHPANSDHNPPILSRAHSTTGLLVTCRSLILTRFNQ